MKKILRFLLVFAAMFCMTCFTAFAEDTDCLLYTSDAADEL